jgi:hypothetical protein
MCLPDTYRLPRRQDEALKLDGKGLVVPAVPYLTAALLEPLLDAGEAAPVAPVRIGLMPVPKLSPFSRRRRIIASPSVSADV